MTKNSSNMLSATVIFRHVCKLNMLYEVIKLQAQLQVDDKDMLKKFHEAEKDSICVKASVAVHLT